jgi:hypothetical protein
MCALPEMKEEGDDGGDKVAVAQGLLVAADRYGVERLKLICEDILCIHVEALTAVTMLELGDKYGCHRLMGACIKVLRDMLAKMRLQQVGRVVALPGADGCGLQRQIKHMNQLTLISESQTFARWWCTVRKQFAKDLGLVGPLVDLEEKEQRVYDRTTLISVALVPQNTNPGGGRQAGSCFLHLNDLSSLNEKVLSRKFLYSHSCTLTFEFTTQTCMCGQHRCKNFGINGCVLDEFYKSLIKI